MNTKSRTLLRATCIAAAAALVASAVVPGYGESPATAPADTVVFPKGKLELLLVPPSEDYYPCTDCHEPGTPVNRTPRKLVEEHEDIVLEHGGGRLWCLDCHSADNRDFLHTAGGKPIPFERAHELCGQCHFRRYKDWSNNAHGKRIGNWNGDKKVFVCFSCHEQHSPRFKPLTPKPRPARPDEIR